MNKLVSRLLKGNKDYLNNSLNRNISPERRTETSQNGQHPFAIIITCSDSRVIPEDIFNCGIGELFVIRVAGNVIGEQELGSIEYATEHLKCQLVVVLGHTKCGAVTSALSEEGYGYVSYLLKPIKKAIGNEKDLQKAIKINAIASREIIKEKFNNSPIEVISMLYDIESGEVEIL